MKNFWCLFFFLIALFSPLSSFGSQNDALSDLELSNRFHRFLVRCDSTYQKKIKFNEKFQYQRIPLILRIKYSNYVSIVKIFDVNDSLYEEHEVPILKVIFYKYDIPAYIAEVARSKNMNGKRIIEVAKSLQKLFHAKEMELIDVAMSVQCPYDGKFCQDEAVMDLKTMGIMTFGKAYYEQLGATSQDEPYYGMITNFLRQLKIENLTYDLKKLGKKYPAAQKIRELIMECNRGCNLSTHTHSMEELAKSVYSESKFTQEKHLRWHRFCDTIFANKEKFFSQYTWDLLADPDQDIRLKTLVANYAKPLLGDLTWFSHKNSKKEEQDYLAKHASEIDPEKPHIFCFLTQTSFQSRKRMYKNGSPCEPIKELRELLTFIENFQNVYIQKDKIDQLLELIQEYQTTDVSKLPAGHLYGLWMLAKATLNDLDRFVFTLE